VAVADSRVAEVESRLGTLRSLRAPRESGWKELQRLTTPLAQDLQTSTKDGRVSGELYDFTAGHGATNLAAGLWSMGTNSATPWFSIRPENDDLGMDRDISAWCDRVTSIMLRSFAANGGNFYAQSMSYFLSVATLGTAVMYSDEAIGAGQLRHNAIPLAESHIAQNSNGQVDTNYRTYNFTSRQCAQEWGADALHPAMRKVLEKEPDRKWRLVHAVEPNPDADPRRRGRAFMATRSRYIDLDNRHILEDGGYHEFPYHVMRWWVQSGEVYGDGPAALARPDAKTVNVMGKTLLEGAQASVRPPILTTDEMELRGIRLQPGQAYPGAIDPWTGRVKVQTLQTGGAIGLGLELEQQRRQAIKDAFYWQAMILQPGDRATATEVLALQEQQLQVMGPHLGRMNTEFLTPVISRAFNLLIRAGAFPPPPPALTQAPGLKVIYVSPLARAQSIAQAGGIMRFLEGLGTMAQMNPAVLDNVDFDDAARRLATAFHTPASLLKDPRQVAADRQARAEQQAAAAQMAEAQTGAQIARDLGQAAMAAGGAA